ncbi:NB-ARC domain-containing protein [Actinophytocola oryzae]|uniref:NB-ARC domain-containing protein n=1 Tax=Actinophytocola oryzae TaxID=502181 RepID=A0A4R7W0N7_9PSEU|nr:NB-ARC domain-containing protein [Actinophytocola oryzae]TDV56080.1 NB-ARC domain-containing protein [Actinophytocola oryzae]
MTGLPRVVPLVGRAAVLNRIAAGLRQRATPVLCVVSGPVGAGKTVLAVHAARRMADRFPDGALFVALRGEDGTPVPVRTALSTVLGALDVAEHPDADVEVLAGSLRSRLADTRTLLVLDGASDETQVRPLLPATRGCAALVTSRDPLTVLHATARVDLTGIEASAAVALLTAEAGVPPATDHAEALTRRCERSPLALSIAGRRLGMGETPEDLLAQPLLDMLDDGERSVRAVLDGVCRPLPAPSGRMLRLLGLLDWEEFSAATAAALLDTTPAEAALALNPLVRARLVDLVESNGADPAGGTRFGMTALVRAWARERAEHDDHDRDAAVRRAVEQLGRLAERVLLARPRGTEPELSDDSATDPRAFRERDRAALRTAAAQAMDQGLVRAATVLASAAGVEAALPADGVDGHALVAVGRALLHRNALEAAGAALGRAIALFVAARDVLGEAAARHLLADALRMRGRLAEAQAQAAGAVACCGAIADERAGWRATAALGRVHHDAGHEDTARRLLSAAVAGSGATGDEVGAASAALWLGDLLAERADITRARRYYRDALRGAGADDTTRVGALAGLTVAAAAAGDSAAAAEHLAESRRVTRRSGDREADLATVAGASAYLHRFAGDLPSARAAVTEAVRLWQAAGAVVRTARTRVILGHVLAADGDPAAAIEAWSQAYGAFCEAGSARAAGVATLLATAQAPADREIRAGTQ